MNNFTTSNLRYAEQVTVRNADGMFALRHAFGLRVVSTVELSEAMGGGFETMTLLMTEDGKIDREDESMIPGTCDPRWWYTTREAAEQGHAEVVGRYEAVFASADKAFTKPRERRRGKVAA